MKKIRFIQTLSTYRQCYKAGVTYPIGDGEGGVDERIARQAVACLIAEPADAPGEDSTETTEAPATPPAAQPAATAHNTSPAVNSGATAGVPPTQAAGEGAANGGAKHRKKSK